MNQTNPAGNNPQNKQVHTGGAPVAQTSQGQGGGGQVAAAINPAEIKTPSGKTLQDFRIPEALLKNDVELVDYIMRSESMKDEERQYWFNLTEVMNAQQVEKLRDILSRERKKLAEIDAKYGKKPPVDPVEAARKAKIMADKRAAQQAQLKAREAQQQAQEVQDEEDILSELDNV